MVDNYVRKRVAVEERVQKWSSFLTRKGVLYLLKFRCFPADHTLLCEAPTNFRCRDGKCIAGANVVCNDVNECDDGTDETNCGKI